MLLRMRVEQAPEGTAPAFQEGMQDELARLSRFVERSLLAAKAECGALEAAATALNLSDLVRDVTEDYQLLAGERGLSMTMELTPDIRINSDSDLLRQALHGLLENAVRYAKSDIHVSCRMEGRQAVLEIRNDFDSATMATSGLGLGLRVVRGVCKACKAEFDSRQTGHEFHAVIRFTPAT
jgi:signal transduction histidine kinase